MLLKPTQNQPVRPRALASDSFEVFVPICFGDVDPNFYVCLDFLGKVNNITYQASSGCCLHLGGGSSACLMINHIKRYQEISRDIKRYQVLLQHPQLLVHSTQQTMVDSEPLRHLHL